LLGMVCLEFALRLYCHFPTLPGAEAITGATRYDPISEVTRWKIQFLDLYKERGEEAIPISQNEYRPHPTFGWVPNANLSFTDTEGRRYTTNSQGFRSPHDYVRDDRFTVLVVGDSFTYGSGADDSDVWPTILQTIRPEINVLNCGVGAYGTDQMLLMLEEQVKIFHPDLVIAAYISDDLRRSLLPFRDYWKPYFLMEDGSLILKGIPIPELSSGVERIKRDVRLHRIARFLGRSRVLSILLNIVELVVPDSPVHSTDDKNLLNELIFERMITSTRAAGAEIILVYLPNARWLVDPDLESPGEEFLREFVGNHDVRVLNTRPIFLKQEQQFSQKHYQRPAASVVAGAVSDELDSLTGGCFPASKK